MTTDPSNISDSGEENGENGEFDTLKADDATWILTASFVIFTMQTGFGLLESGAVAKKNEVNIMMKNVVDIVLGGLFYWMFGYGLQYGTGPGSNPVFGFGSFFLDADADNMGPTFATFIFQLSFATTATTIVSGAMAERTNYNAYCIFSFLNSIVYCIPAGWLWSDQGFLKTMGALDYAGAAGVHLVGGVSGLVATAMLKPRLNRCAKGTASLPMGNPTNAIVGTFTLWWGWLVFNCGSTFGVSGSKWQYAARAAVTTINGSLTGGLVGLIYSYWTSGTFEVSPFMNSILAGLVSITGGAGYFQPWEALVIGAIGAFISCLIPPILDRLHIDDPVSAVAVHAGAGVWGTLAVGIFTEDDKLIDYTSGMKGVVRGGGPNFFGVQALVVCCVTGWSIVITYLLLKLIHIFIPIRMKVEEEILGADFCEHGICHDGYDYKGAIEELTRRGFHLNDNIKNFASPDYFEEELIEKYFRKKLRKSFNQRKFFKVIEDAWNEKKKEKTENAHPRAQNQVKLAEP